MNRQENDSVPHPSLSAWLGLALAIAISGVGFFVTTQHGMGVGNDSPAFTGPALARLEGREFTTIHHPPLYAGMLWALAATAGTDVIEAAGWLQLAAMTALLAGVCWQLRWSLPRNQYAAAAGVLLVATSFSMVECVGNLGNDLAGAALAVWSLGMLARHIASPDDRRWLGFCILGGMLAFLNRYAGFSVVLTISTVIWWRRGRPWGRDLAKALAAGVLMVLPCALHMLANAIGHHNANDRQWAWNGIPWDRVCESFSTLAVWYLPSAISGWPAGVALVVAGMGLVCLTGWWPRADIKARSLLLVLVTFAALNLVFLVGVISSQDFWLSLDSRVLLPLLPCSMVGVVLMAHGWAPGSRWRRRLVPFLFVFLVATNVRRSASLMAAYGVMGRWQLDRTVQQGTLAGWVHAHDGAAFITNNPPFFANITRHASLELPVAFNLLSNRPNPDADAQMRQLSKLWKGRRPVFLVVFASLDNPRRVPAEELLAGTTVKRVLHDYFVSVYQPIQMSLESVDRTASAVFPHHP